MRAISVMAVLAVGLGGCVGGGGGRAKEKPLTAAEKRAELDRWVARADGACRKSNDAIAERGWPRNLIQLDRLAVRAVDDVREASRAVQGLVPPKGSEERVKPFVASLKALDGLLDDVTDTTDEPPEEAQRAGARPPRGLGGRRADLQGARPARVRGQRRAHLGA